MTTQTRLDGPPQTDRRSWVRDIHGLALPMRTFLAVAVVVAAWALTTVMPEGLAFTVTIIATATVWASCLNIVVGFTGQLNLSLGAFLALGAYLGTLATGYWGIPGPMMVVGVVAVGAALAALLSLVVFRAKGLQFALLTAGLSLVTYSVLITWSDVTGGSAGLSTGGPITTGGIPKPLDLGFVSLSTTKEYLVATVALLCFILWLTTLLLRTREGAGWIAVREDETLSASLGIRVRNRKRVAFILCSTFATLAGILYAHWVGYITPTAFSFTSASFDPLAMVVIGGTGTVAGPILGAVVVSGLPRLVRDLQDYSILIYGLVLLIVVIAAPKGLLGLVKSGWSQVKAFAASLRRNRG